MSKLKQLIGSQTGNLSVRALAHALDLSIGAVSKYLRSSDAGLALLRVRRIVRDSQILEFQ